MAEMKIKALGPWFGSKRNLAREIVRELGPHQAYWEPFCGSMAILLAKEPCGHEYVNDLHGGLINLGRVVQDATLGPKLYRRLRRAWSSEALQKECREKIEAVAGDPLEWAFAYFVESWLGRNGVAGTYSTNGCFCVRYTAKGGAAATRFASAVESIPAWRRRLRRVMITQRDGLELCERIEDAAGTAIYCDPPYLKKGARYVHDFESAEHERLAKLLTRFRRARVVVSYYDDPRLTQLYPGWTQHKITVSKAMAHQAQRGANDTRAVEVLLLNGPSYGQDQGGLFGQNEGESEG